MAFGFAMGLGCGLMLRFCYIGTRTTVKFLAFYGLGLGIGTSFGQFSALADAFLMGDRRKDEKFYKEVDSIKDEVELLSKVKR